MKDVGIKLQNKRVELNLTYNDVSRMTKLPLTTIKAIENGDLDFFQNDLTYVRFYVRSYCKALNVPYENLKDDVLESVDEYTTTMSMNTIKKHEEMEANIEKKASQTKHTKSVNLPDEKQPKLAKKDRVSIAKNTKQSRRFTKSKNVDFAFLSLIVVIVIIICVLLFVGVKALLDRPSEAPKTDDPITENGNNTPKPEGNEKENEDDDEKKEPEVTDNKITFQQVTPSAYVVNGVKANEPLKIEVTFKNQGSFNLWKGNISAPNASGVYEAGSTYTFEGTAVTNEVFTFNFWNYGGAEIKVNGKQVDYNQAAQVADASGVVYFTLTMKGE